MPARHSVQRDSRPADAATIKRNHRPEKLRPGAPIWPQTGRNMAEKSHPAATASVRGPYRNRCTDGTAINDD